MYMRERSSLEDERFVVSKEGRRRRTPSFSSSLLDSIYRSIDESNGGDLDDEMSKKQSKQSSSVSNITKQSKTNLRRAMMIENWVERQSVHSSMFTPSGSSSSESTSSGNAFSSSEQTESSSYYKRRSSKQSTPLKLAENNIEKAKSESGGGFTKTKLKALKIYSELKKAKQPISPGGKIASFINSIFNSGNVKKAKMCYVGAVEDVSITSENVTKSSTYYASSSPASTFSRSCLSKPSSSRSKKPNNGGDKKRSVKFYPVSMILGENEVYSKCGYQHKDPSLMPKPTFQKHARNSGQDFRTSFCEDLDEDEDEDDESDSSSDLFELNLPVGIGRYTEELPVYETTNFRTNQAIAKGLIL